MTVSITNAMRSLLADQFVAELDSGAGASTLVIYGAGSGVPANAGVAITDQPTLCSITLPDPSFGAAANGVATKNGTWQGTAVADGTAAFYRFINGDGEVCSQGSIGTSGQDLNLNSVNIVNGGTVTVSTFTHTQPQ